MRLEETRMSEILPIYNKIYNACNDLTEGIIELSKLNLVDEDIEKINKLDLEASRELMLLADGINCFKENSEQLLDAII